MKPTHEQLRDPKWWDENAPEGAEVFIDELYFAKWVGGREFNFYCCDGEWVCAETQFSKNRYFKEQKEGVWVIDQRPTAPSWNGEGLPPVGCECEYVPDPVCAPHIAVKGVFIGRVNDEDFIDVDGHVDRMKAIDPARRFRPLRTPEQRLRDEIIELLEDTSHDTSDIADAILAKYELKERNQ